MKKIKFLILTSLTTLLMAPVTYASLPKTSENLVTNVLISQGLKSEEIKQKAEAITVKIESDNSAGSGVIIGKEGNTYTVLTNAHVVNRKVPNQIITIDGKSHESKVIQEGNSLEGNDLAVLTFNSPDNYQVANLPIDSDIKENQAVYSVGFPEETNEFYFSQGTIKLTAPKPFLGGYQIGYDIDVKAGMSGGALLNEKGELIGVNGLLKGPVLNEAYNYLDGSQPFEQNIATYRNLSFAVPVETLIDVAPNLALIPNEWKTGLNIAENVDNIARKITVRIDNNNLNRVEGSGAIVGKDGDTYYVFTACHVVFKYDKKSKSCQIGKLKDDLTLVTPDSEKYPLNANNIILPQGLDAAIIKFESKKAYKVATIGKYNIPVNRKQLIFLSGFPTELKGVRKLTAGGRFNRDRGLILSFNSSFDKVDLNVNISGLELLYTNLTKPGMSGGPVLDSKGQVIGINTGQEGAIVSLTDVHQLGFAHGVPATRLLAFANQKQVNLNHFQISQQAPKKISDRDWKTVKRHPAFVIETPPKDSNETTWLNYGNELLRLERKEEAIIAYQKALEINPDFPEAYYGLGFIYEQVMYIKRKNTDNKNTGKAEALKAIEAFDQVVELRPYSPVAAAALHRKSMVLQELEQYEEALVAIDESIKSIDDDFKTYDQRGGILEGLGRYSEAKEAYDKSIEIYPSGFSYFGRGYLLSQKLNKPQEAIKDFDKAIELDMIFAYGVRATAYYILNNHEAALADVNKALEFQPEEASIYGMRGIIYSTMKDYPQALVDYTNAIELEPNNAKFYNGRTYTYLGMGNIPQALADKTKVIELEPKNDDHYFQRQNLYFLNGQYKLALEDISQAIKLNPKEAKYYQKSGTLKNALGDNQGALEDYNKAIEINPNYAQAYYSRGSLYVTTFFDSAKGIADLTRAIDLNPKFGGAYVMRGLLQSQLSDFQGALEDYNRAILLNKDPDPKMNFLWNGIPVEEYESLGVFGQISYSKSKGMEENDKNSRAAEIHKHRGDLRLKLKDTEGALQDYNEAIKLAPQEANIYVGRGDYYTQTQQPEKAKADYNQAIKIYSETIKNKKTNLSAYSGRADVYTKLQNYEAAIADYSKAINIQGPTLYLRYENRAEAYHKIKDYEAAIKDLSKAIELQPKLIRSYMRRALIYLEIKNYEAAIKDFSQVIKSDNKIDDPSVKFAYTYRCMSYTELKDYNQAINDCDQAIKIAPNNPEVYLASAILHHGLKNYSAALEDAKKIIELTPDLPIGYWVRGVMYWSQNNPTKALSDCELALTKNNQFAPAISCIGFVKYQQGDKQKAIELWQKAVTIQDDLADTKLAFAVGLYHQGQPEKALSLAKEAIDMDGRLGDINHLKDNLWGEQLIKDTEPLLNKLK